MPKIPPAPPPNPPKKINTFQDFVKKDKKRLDKPTKTVYNIRKDAREVQDLWKNYIYSNDRVELNNAVGYHDHIRMIVMQRASSVKELCEANNLPLPIMAGGALRDLIWNCMPNDYDFFFNFLTEDEAYEFMDLLTLAMNRHGGYTVGGPNNQYENTDENFEGVYGVFNWGASCQLIVGVWPECKDHIYEHFDLSVCEAEMDLETFDITLSEDFLWSIHEMKIKNNRPDSIYSTKRKAMQEYNLQLNRQHSINKNPCAEFEINTIPRRNEYFVTIFQDGIRAELPVRPEQ